MRNGRLLDENGSRGGGERQINHIKVIELVDRSQERRITDCIVGVVQNLWELEVRMDEHINRSVCQITRKLEWSQKRLWECHIHELLSLFGQIVDHLCESHFLPVLTCKGRAVVDGRCRKEESDDL